MTSEEATVEAAMAPSRDLAPDAAKESSPAAAKPGAVPSTVDKAAPKLRLAPAVDESGVSSRSTTAVDGTSSRDNSNKGDISKEPPTKKYSNIVGAHSIVESDLKEGT